MNKNSIKILFTGKLFQLTFLVIKWLVITTCDNSLPLHHFELLCNKLLVVHRQNGPKHTILYVKAIRGNFYNYLSGNVLRNPLSSSTKDGIPVALGPLITLVRKRHMRAIALILTILSATRALKLEASPDFETITQPVKGDVPNLEKHMADFWRALGYRPTLFSRPKSLKVNINEYRLSRGPNGRVINTALYDIEYLSPNLREALKKISPKLGSLISIFSDKRLVSFFDDISKKFRNDDCCSRRLSVFADKEGKTRIIGVLDHYSQIALKPFHTWLARCLSKIKQDCTLDQSKFKGLLLERGVETFYSVDLSAATDRFPIHLIERLLLFQLPYEYVKAWKEIMVGSPFHYEGREFNYAAGNPMGAYSSFNSFALAHHYIIYYCCRECGVSWKTAPYALLGDDIVIGNDSVAKLYKQVISSLHIDYSPAKTHESKDFFEFAKRIFYKGEEITPFPISSIKENHKSPSAWANLLLEQQSRGWKFNTILSSSELFYGSVLNFRRKRIKLLLKRISTAEGVLSLVRGLQTGEQYLNDIVSSLRLPLPHINMDVCKSIISNIAVETFSESAVHGFFKSSEHSDLPLWSELIIMKKKWDLYIEDNFLELSHVQLLRHKHFFMDTPFVQAVKAVEQEYVTMMKRLEKVDSTGSDWSYYMRNFALPTSSKSIMEGNKFTLMRSLDRLSELIEERLLIICQYPQLLEM